MGIRIAAVVVTFNRIDLLKSCIGSLRNQSRKLDEIIIVNNSSTDGTFEWLNEQRDLTVITQSNSGSAGGQYTGIKSAFEKGYDWVWSLDADVVPHYNALEMFLISDAIKDKSVGFLSSIIFTPENKLSYINLPYLEKGISITLDSLSSFNSLTILSASFGSVLFSSNAIRIVGYPIPDFFIWGDDVEYTFRMREKNLMGYLVSSSKATHYEKNNFQNPFLEMDYKDSKAFYAVRNTIYILKLRSRVLNKPRMRGVGSSVLFYFSTLVGRIKKKNLDLITFIKFSRYFLSGLAYNPRKYLKHEAN